MTVFVHKIAAKNLCTLFIEADNQRMLSKALSAAFESTALLYALPIFGCSAVNQNGRFAAAGSTLVAAVTAVNFPRSFQFVGSGNDYYIFAEL